VSCNLRKIKEETKKYLQVKEVLIRRIEEKMIKIVIERYWRVKEIKNNSNRCLLRIIKEEGRKLLKLKMRIWNKKKWMMMTLRK